MEILFRGDKIPLNITEKLKYAKELQELERKLEDPNSNHDYLSGMIAAYKRFLDLLT